MTLSVPCNKTALESHPLAAQKGPTSAAHVRHPLKKSKIKSGNNFLAQITNLSHSTAKIMFFATNRSKFVIIKSLTDSGANNF